MTGRFLCIPSYNGVTAHFEPLLDATTNFVKSGFINEVVLVDDGSKDSTAYIARSKGVTVISHEHNKGKSAAFATGIKYGASRSYDAVIMCDDDMIELQLNHVQQSLNPIIKGQALMTVSPYTQGQLICPHDYSGFRSISLDFLRPIYDQTSHKYSEWNSVFEKAKWGLELALDMYCPKNERQIVHIDGLHSKPRGGKTTNAQLHNTLAHTYLLLKCRSSHRYQIRV
jgi:glycosyltransferase involved in cell wall biosynthesis